MLQYCYSITLLATILHVPAPSIHEFPSDIKSTEGEMVHLRVRVSGHPTPTINWYHDGVAVRADYSREIDEHGGLMFPSVKETHSGADGNIMCIHAVRECVTMLKITYRLI